VAGAVDPDWGAAAISTGNPFLANTSIASTC